MLTRVALGLSMLIIAVTVVALPTTGSAWTQVRDIALAEQAIPSQLLVAETTRPGSNAASLLIELSGPQQSFIFDLFPSVVVGPDATTVHVTDAGAFESGYSSELYQGRVRGHTDSRVAGSLDNGRFSGLARIGTELYFFEPAQARDSAAEQYQVLAYRLSDMMAGSPLAREFHDRLEGSLDTERQLGGAFPAVLEIAVVADNEFFSRHGADSATRMAAVINLVDVIYIDQLNVTLRISHSQVFETSSDPFSEFNSGNLFSNFKNATTEFGQWRSSTGGSVKAAGLGHLFSDKTLGLSSGGAGFGFTNTLCNGSRGVSISTTRFFNSDSFHALIVAHEFGHNFGADHDGESGSCPSAPGGFIMAPSATGNAFSDCSKAIMTARGEAANCIVEGTGPPVPCGQPVSQGDSPTATDCLFILNAAVGLATCEPTCQCVTTGNLPISATDALLCLNAAVGAPVTLNCPC